MERSGSDCSTAFAKSSVSNSWDDDARVAGPNAVSFGVGPSRIDIDPGAVAELSASAGNISGDGDIVDSATATKTDSSIIAKNPPVAGASGRRMIVGLSLASARYERVRSPGGSSMRRCTMEEVGGSRWHVTLRLRHLMVLLGGDVVVRD